MRYADILAAVEENKKRACVHQSGVDATIAEAARLHRETFRKYHLGENVVMVFRLNGGLSFDANERMGFLEAKPNLKFTSSVLAKAAEIAAEVEKWIRGERDDLLPSTWDKPIWNDKL